MTLMIAEVEECVCGECRPCRRALFGAAVPPTITEILPTRAPDRIVHPPKSKADPAEPKRAKRGNVKGTKDEGRFASTEPVPCSDCGELRVVVKMGKALVVAGKDGKCELCFDQVKLIEIARLHYSGEKVLGHKALRRTTLQLQRVRKDDRPFHPDAVHGKESSYAEFGCRCEPCRDAKAGYLSGLRERKRNA